MDFFYPNRTNMMWEIFGLVFYNDASRLVDVPNKTFRKDEIVQLLLRQGIAIFDTAQAVRRLGEACLARPRRLHGGGVRGGDVR